MWYNSVLNVILFQQKSSKIKRFEHACLCNSSSNGYFDFNGKYFFGNEEHCNLYNLITRLFYFKKHAFNKHKAQNAKKLSNM